MPKVLEEWTVQPHDALVELADGILTVAGEIRMPLGNFPRRMTVVRLRGRRTAIYSAIALREPEMARIEALGAPSVLIVPSGAHRLDAKIWRRRYPALRVLAPAGARDDVAQVVPVDATGDGLDDPQVRFVTVPGTGEREAALEVRRGDGLTVICNDVIGNVAHPHGIGAYVMGRLMGFGVSEPQIPRIVQHKVVEEPAALAVQFRAWAGDPELRRVVVSHGDVIAADAAGVLEKLAASLD